MKTKKYWILAIVSFSILLVLWPTHHTTGETDLFAKDTKPDSNLTGREKSGLSYKMLPKLVQADEKEILQGLEGVRVVVEDIEPDVEKYGLTKQNLQTDTELQLRQYGIKVFTDDEWPSIPAMAYLYINVNVLIKEDNPHSAAAAITVQFKESVLLLRKPKRICMFACTWESGKVVHSALLRIKDIRGSLNDLVNHFINDYLAANPKEPEKKKPTVEEYNFEALEELLEKAAEGNDKQPKD